MDLKNILEISYLSKTRMDFLNELKIVSNESKHNERQSKEKVLNDYSSEIIGRGNWKDKLEATDLQEFLSYRPGGCGPERKRRSDHDEKKCKECRAYRSYDNTPISIVRFIRNVDEHAPEKIRNHPGGATETKLYPNGYDDKNAFLDFWMELFPKLFHIISYLRNKSDEVYRLNWTDDRTDDSSVTTQVVTGLRNAVDTARDHGAIITKFERDQSDKGALQKIEILVAPTVVFTNYGKVVTVTNRRLEVKHISGETLSYQVENSRHPDFMMIFGQETLMSTQLSSSHVVVLISPNVSVEDVSRLLTRFGNYHKVGLKWSDISNVAQLRLQNEGQIVIQNQTYTADNFRLYNLEGSQLVELLKTGALEVFRPDDIYENYVTQHLVFNALSEPSLDDDAVYFVTDSFDCFPACPDQSIELKSEEELMGIHNLTVKYVLFKYRVSFDKVYDKLVNLAVGRCHRLIICTPLDKARNQYERIILDREFSREVKAKLVFLSGGAGEGKTEVLKYLHASQSLRETVFIHTTAIGLLKNCTLDVNVLDGVAKTCDLNDFETEIMEAFQKVLLIDALDEVKPSEFASAERLIHELVKVPGLQVVVSVRNHLIDEIKTKFSSAHFCALYHLTENSQVAIYLSHWRHPLKDGVNGNRTPGEMAALFIVTSHRSLLGWRLTPLLCKMLAEIYGHKGHIEAPNAFEPLCETQIYKQVVNKNFNRYLLEKMNAGEKDTGHHAYDKMKKEYFFAHVSLAFITLEFDLDQFKVALEHPDVVLCPGQGLLNNVAPVEFIHKTFPEFILDSWIVQVVSGELTLPTESRVAFSRLFVKRCFSSTAHCFVEELLEEHKGNIPRFDFELSVYDLKVFAALIATHRRRFIVKLLILSLIKYHEHEFNRQNQSLEQPYLGYLWGQINVKRKDEITAEQQGGNLPALKMALAEKRDKFIGLLKNKEGWEQDDDSKKCLRLIDEENVLNQNLIHFVQKMQEIVDDKNARRRQYELRSGLSKDKKSPSSQDRIEALKDFSSLCQL